MNKAARRLPQGLYLITPDTPDTEALIARVEVALKGEPVMLQYRNKCLTGDAQLEQAAEIRTRCYASGVPFIMNDNLELAVRLDADGVHLGREDGDVSRARARLGGERILGVSCYNEWPLAEAAAAAGADYVAFGAMYPSSTKPGAVAASVDLLTRARKSLSVGVVAIGGITLDNAVALVGAGASQLAVISDVFDAPDPAARARAYAQLYASQSNHSA